MGQGKPRVSPAMVVATLALFLALGGSVYAARSARINGRAIKPASVPGNRLLPRSVPANRLRPRSIPANRLRPGALRRAILNRPLTGAEINELTLSQVPEAARAEEADTARWAARAEAADSAEVADDARTVNGHAAGCLPDTRPFAGACWERSPSGAVPAKQAARRCTERGGTLPGALELAAFAEVDGVHLSSGGEWSGDISIVNALENYSVVYVTNTGEIDIFTPTQPLSYRCVIPMLR